jgi:hypothetical protein
MFASPSSEKMQVVRVCDLFSYLLFRSDFTFRHFREMDSGHRLDTRGKPATTKIRDSR